MDLNSFYKSVLEQDNTAIVICDLNHKIIYMNPVAKVSYHGDLTGQDLLECHNQNSNNKIKKVVAWFMESKDHNRVHIAYSQKHNKDEYMIALRNDEGKLIGYYEKHEYRTKDSSVFYENIKL